jgi:hypothetical protein
MSAAALVDRVPLEIPVSATPPYPYPYLLFYRSLSFLLRCLGMRSSSIESMLVSTPSRSFVHCDEHDPIYHRIVQINSYSLRAKPAKSAYSTIWRQVRDQTGSHNHRFCH